MCLFLHKAGIVIHPQGSPYKKKYIYKNVVSSDRLRQEPAKVVAVPLNEFKTLHVKTLSTAIIFFRTENNHQQDHSSFT